MRLEESPIETPVGASLHNDSLGQVRRTNAEKVFDNLILLALCILIVFLIFADRGA